MHQLVVSARGKKDQADGRFKPPCIYFVSRSFHKTDRDQISRNLSSCPLFLSPKWCRPFLNFFKKHSSIRRTSAVIDECFIVIIKYSWMAISNDIIIHSLFPRFSFHLSAPREKHAGYSVLHSTIYVLFHGTLSMLVVDAPSYYDLAKFNFGIIMLSRAFDRKQSFWLFSIVTPSVSTCFCSCFQKASLVYIFNRVLSFLYCCHLAQLHTFFDPRA